MTQRQALHAIVDDLPEDELATAERVLEALRATADLAVVAEGDGDDDFDGGLTEARAAADRGEGITTEELRRRLGIA